MSYAMCHDDRMFLLKPPRRVLIVSLRFLGDALISSMMADGIKRQWPQCRVDFLVYAGMQGVLAGNGCVDTILTLPSRAQPLERLRMLARLWRSYDLAMTAQSGDFPHQVLWAAARQRVGALPENPQHAWWKKRSAPLSVPELPHEHIANRCARLLAPLGISMPLQVRVPQSLAAAADQPAGLQAAGAYVVLNPCARWRYKRWHDAGWLALVAHLQQRGLQVVVTGGDSEFEKHYLDALLQGSGESPSLLRLDGQLDFAQAAQVLAGAALYVGPDTFTTHLAAACQVPTVALFGPTDPRIWGPLRTIKRMAHGDMDAGYAAVQAVQNNANTWLLQNPQHACVPCQQEGCERHPQSESLCLDGLPTTQVLGVVDTILARAVPSHSQKHGNAVEVPAA